MRKILLSFALGSGWYKTSRGIVAAVVVLIAAISYTKPSEIVIYDFVSELLNEKLQMLPQ